MAKSPLTGCRPGQKPLSGNHVCPRTRSHSLPLRPHPAWYSRPICIGRRLGYPVGKEATGTRTHVPLANEACDDKGRPSALGRALGQMPKVEPPPPTRSLGNLTLHSPEISPTAPCHHGAEVRTPPFVNISSFFYSARILVQNISIDPWKAVSNGSQQASGQSGGQRAEEWAAAPEAHSRL